MSQASYALPAGVTARTVETPRLATCLLESGRESAIPTLDAYAASGGAYREEAISDCGHTPHVERPEESRQIVFGFLGEHGGGLAP